MRYIKNVVPMDNFRLYVEMEGGSTAIVDFTGRFNTMKYAELSDEKYFKTVKTDGDYVFWGDGRLKITVNELMKVILLG